MPARPTAAQWADALRPLRVLRTVPQTHPTAPAQQQPAPAGRLVGAAIADVRRFVAAGLASVTRHTWTLAVSLLLIVAGVGTVANRMAPTTPGDSLTSPHRSQQTPPWPVPRWEHRRSPAPVDAEEIINRIRQKIAHKHKENKR